MRNKNWLLKLGLVILCGAVLLGPADRLSGADDFYVVAGGSPWIRSGANIYFSAGNVGIGTNQPENRLEISTDINSAVSAQTSAIGAAAIQGVRCYRFRGWFGSVWSYIFT